MKDDTGLFMAETEMATSFKVELVSGPAGRSELLVNGFDAAQIFETSSRYRLGLHYGRAFRV